MKRKNLKEITCLPLNCRSRRCALGILRAIYSKLERFIGRIDGWFLKRLEAFDSQLALPKGTLVSQHEHDQYPKGPWKVVRFNGDDYMLVHAIGVELFNKYRERVTHIYVYPRYVRPLPEQPPAPAAEEKT